MNVTAILKLKGRKVATAGPETTLGEIARRLAEERIGAIVITAETGGIVGIVSERDIIRSIAEQGTTSLQQPATSAMTRGVETCDVDDTLDELMSRMTAGRFRHLPVIEDGKLAGIVSIGDVVKHHIAEVELEAIALREYIVHG